MTPFVEVTNVLENSVAMKFQVTEEVPEYSYQYKMLPPFQGKCTERPPVLNSGTIKRADTHKSSILH